MKQREVWAATGGDLWLNKNRPDLGNSDPVSAILTQVEGFKSIIEVGCSNGWRLHKIKQKYEGVRVAGIDPSKQGVNEAREKGLEVVEATADAIPFPDDAFDVVILGFCMWATEPRDWFKIVAEVDRILIERGIIIIHDYFPNRPFRRQWASWSNGKYPTIYTSHFDWPKLWTSHPGYTVLVESFQVFKMEGVSVLRKQHVDCLRVVEEPAP